MLIFHVATSKSAAIVVEISNTNAFSRCNAGYGVEIHVLGRCFSRPFALLFVSSVFLFSSWYFRPDFLCACDALACCRLVKCRGPRLFPVLWCSLCFVLVLHLFVIFIFVPCEAKHSTASKPTTILVENDQFARIFLLSAD